MAIIMTTKDNTDSEEQKITPFEVKSKSGINYMKLIEQFGCSPIHGDLIKRFEEVTNVKAHKWLRRGIFFSNKDLSNALDEYEKGNPVYLYTGRGPSSESMHLGHMIPFVFTQWLQYALDAIVVIQMSDDEKYSFKGKDANKPLEYYNSLTYKNVVDIIACGFDLDRTFIFSNLKTVGGELYSNTVKLMSVSGNKINSIYGLDLNNSIGQLAWPPFQCAPAYSNSFSDILHPNGSYSEPEFDGSKVYTGKHIMCLVPMAIDQDPYFRMARDFAEQFKKEGYRKPATIHTKFLVGLEGINGKMSSTGDQTDKTLYMTDEPKVVQKKIMKHAFSGGKETLELHRLLGGELETDVAYQYLCYFLDDDEELKQIATKYRNGEMLSGEIKKIAADVIGKYMSSHQAVRNKITDDDIKKYFNRNRKFNMEKSKREKIQLESDEVYANYGVNFDLYFGLEPPKITTDQIRKLSDASLKMLLSNNILSSDRIVA